jgi:hypothetical protein
MFKFLFTLSIGFLFIIFIVYKQIKNQAQQNRKLFFEKLQLSNKSNSIPLIIGFFHPYW